MARQLEVLFSVQFSSTITVEDNESISDAVINLNIPEDDDTKYVIDTFEVNSVTDVATGVVIDPVLEDNPIEPLMDVSDSLLNLEIVGVKPDIDRHRDRFE